MKRFTGLVLFILLFIGVTFSFRNGVAKKGHDKTGSPLSNGKCIDCHSAGKFGVSLSMKLFDGDNEVNNYSVGHRYKLKLQIKHTGNPIKYGFEVTSLDKDNKSAGKFENMPSGFALKEISGVNYIDHESPRDVEFLNVDWIAPDSHVGDVSIYFGGIAANGNGANSGDGGAVNKLVIKDGASGQNDISDLSSPDLFVVLNNPTYNYLNLGNLKYKDFNYRIITRDGRLIAEKSIINKRSERFLIDVSGFENGLCFIQLISNGQSTTKSFVISN